MKLRCPSQDDVASWVAPRAGAWIETIAGRGTCRRRTSPPARGRGLKQSPAVERAAAERRPPRGGVD